jgi:N-acetylglucosaminyldiphosphoundecaprenol N-acetyl-beta-D-mannosaminyltransferase
MTSLAPRLFEHVIKSGKSIYIVASKQEQVVRAVEIIKERYPDIRIEGYRNGYFANEEEMNREALQIAQVAPDFLIVGMGAVMQERFLLRTKKAGFKGIGFTCGGFIHQTASNQIDYYPAWVDRMNLRFIYRMLKEDYTRKRYFKAALLFPAKFICERIFE